ncbi:MAG: HEPN domain-containing protein [Actinobacteria bacterium]|nr:HEPN domain-containing protein [Actinomycetota bacterium]MBU1494498.1 HEPN domain-containing protein [Actinomycetota bacterium]
MPTAPASGKAREYLAKATEFLMAATAELEAGRSIAATSLAIHAGINAADAVCGARLAERAAGQAHREIIKLLGRAGDDGSELAKDLQRLLPLKTTAEYEPDDISPSKASTAVERAGRCVNVARRVVGSL